jgi:hypothetical protein
MKSLVTKTRGRKPKTVDAEMFYQLVCYYQEKPLINVTQNEKPLAEFVQQFTPNSHHFESVQRKYKDALRDNPRLNHYEVMDKLKGDDFSSCLSEFTHNSPSPEFFDTLRVEEAKNIQKKHSHLSCFNVDDINQVNRLFQRLYKDDARKLLQRLRKMKFEKSKTYMDKKVGIELDNIAYRKIKSFVNDYGFKTLSTGILIMSEMADAYVEGGLTDALERLYRNEILKRGHVFISNAETQRIDDWISEGLIYYSRTKCRYYLSSSCFPDSADKGVYEIDFNDETVMRQMANTSRAFVGTSKVESKLLGTFKKSIFSNEPNMESEVLELYVMNNPRSLIGGADALKAFRAVENLLCKWNLDKTEKIALLSFDPSTMVIDDLAAAHEHLSLLLNIHEELRLLFDNDSNVYGYMKAANGNAPYNGRSPIEVASEGTKGLELVYNSLSALGSQ